MNSSGYTVLLLLNAVNSGVIIVWLIFIILKYHKEKRKSQTPAINKSDTDKQNEQGSRIIELNCKGSELLNKSSGKLYIDLYEDQLIENIKRTNPKCKYDVQERAEKILLDEISDDRFIPIKNYAFSLGKDMEVIIFVMSVYLRDKALAHFKF